MVIVVIHDNDGECIFFGRNYILVLTKGEMARILSSTGQKGGETI